jgi:hypothetical protein
VNSIENSNDSDMSRGSLQMIPAVDPKTLVGSIQKIWILIPSEKIGADIADIRRAQLSYY